ncbi:DUF3784 domain-containing protein [Clostridium intestinale]|uniref:DUF3784 domain-containing protein n=2 Tax=Clostridium intestinale TaxID=36845 RepID=A0A7D6VN24_9CLOT|nr:DUF3784 domain-containing protein [Clostridium intestinale]
MNKMWIMVALFSLLTIVLFSGKGGFLIAGYNTASKEERAKYNEKKLGRVMGSGMGVITIIIAAIPAIFKENTPRVLYWLIPIAIIAVTVVIMILSNTICKEKNPRPIEEVKDINTGKTIKYTLIFLVILFASIGFLLTTGNIKFHLNEENIQIEASDWPDKSINYKEIKSIKIMDNIDIGRRTNGMGSIKLNEGHFRNYQFGDYILYSYTKCKTYIVMEIDSGTLVINTENKSDTEKLYEDIIERTEINK